MSEPKGPVYLTVPRESAMLKLPGKTYFPTRDELGIAPPAYPDPSDARRAAQWLIEARNPCIYAGTAGRNAQSVPGILRVAELLAQPVDATERGDRGHCSPMQSLHRTGPD